MSKEDEEERQAAIDGLLRFADELQRKREEEAAQRGGYIISKPKCRERYEQFVNDPNATTRLCENTITTLEDAKAIVEAQAKTATGEELRKLSEEIAKIDAAIATAKGLLKIDPRG